MDRPEVSINITDARHYIRNKKRYYDCITTDPIHPADAHSNNLYSLEFYQMTNQALKPDGIMCQWLPSADLAPLEIKRIISTFKAAFPFVSLWMPNLSDLALIGSNEALNIDLALLQQRLSDPTTVAGVSRHLNPPTVENFLALFLMGDKAVGAFARDIPLNTDDKPFLEYEAPKNLWNMANLPNLFYEVAGYWSDSFDELWQAVPMTPAGKDSLQAYYEKNRAGQLEMVAESAGMWCRHLEETGDLNAAFVQYERMFSLFPETLNPALLDAAIGMSVIQVKLGNPDLSRDYYQTAITMAPEEILGRNLAAQAFLARGLYADAQREWQEVLKIDPRNKEAAYFLRQLKSQGLFSERVVP